MRISLEVVYIQLSPKLVQHRVHLAAHPVHLFVHLKHALAHIKDGFRASEVHTKVVREPHNTADPLEVSLGVEADFAARSLRLNQSVALVESEGLGVNAEYLGGHANYVA